MVTSSQVKELREKTGISVMQCKKALEDAGGSMEKAILFLKKKGAEIATTKGHRALQAGVIASYIHSDKKIGVLVEVLSETDFVSRNDEFRQFAEDVAMHIAAMNPLFLNEEAVTKNERQKIYESACEDAKDLQKSDIIKQKIVDGKVAAYLKECSLLSQQFVKEPGITIRGLLERLIQKTGENIEITRFVRFSLLK